MEFVSGDLCGEGEARRQGQRAEQKRTQLDEKYASPRVALPRFGGQRMREGVNRGVQDVDRTG